MGQEKKPDYLFEVSWEVCNKIGGIHTVVSTKAPSIVNELHENYILIGPDVWKETHENPEFIEDKFLYKTWREKAESDGLKIRVGRWRIAGEPVVILVDFTPWIPQKDKIFAWLWETYKLDSLSGQWDYIEPALFGYAAGKVIENFYKYNLSAQDGIIAHFHEWLTGTGVLYLLNKTPQVGTVFTTHATVLGRAISGLGMPLYRELKSYNPDSMARQLGVVAKNSLERLAASVSDGFTTVSEITARECSHFLDKQPHVITPNGFDEGIVPGKKLFQSKREASRARILKVAGALLNQKPPDDSLLVLTSGRYEFRNKGTDLFLDALGRINRNREATRNLIAVIAVPAYHAGPRSDLQSLIKAPHNGKPSENDFLTHHLYEPDHDPIMRGIRENGLDNSPAGPVKIIFVPAYLNGNDGIFDMDYYDFLMGFDLTVFPSYYEPWGYTPLESLAFHIPTLTTSLAGFGRWITASVRNSRNSLLVLDRDENDHDKLVSGIAGFITSFARLNADEIALAGEEAGRLSRSVLWENLVSHYWQAYSQVLEKVGKRSNLFRDKQTFDFSIHKDHRMESPNWKKIYIRAKVPEILDNLVRISQNLWWSWNYQAAELFGVIDNDLWEAVGNNPVALLKSLSVDKLRALENDRAFRQRLDSVSGDFDAYMKARENKPAEMIAYFSMEFGLHHSIKTYSGGLGILAGDYLKEASDSNKNIIGIGLLYRQGYFQQKITVSGDQVADYQSLKFSHLPLKPVRDKDGNWMMVGLALPGRTLKAKIWRIDVGSIPLYLLDTDIEENSAEDRTLTYQLYGGDWDNRFKQELLLGVGGIRVLIALGIMPTLFHINEGHAAFIGIERLRKLVQVDGLSFGQALEVVRSSTLFTTHTPVPAGHDSFSEDTLRTYIPHYASQLNIGWDSFVDLGRFTEGNKGERFSVSVLAAKLSSRVNGVSRIHGRVTRELFARLYQGYFPEELHITHVTNGVHYPTWTAMEWQVLYRKTLGPEATGTTPPVDHWKKIAEVPDEEVWNIKMNLKSKLVAYLTRKLTADMTQRQEDPRMILRMLNSLNERTLIIGFARRFATYKRAHLLFNNLERLSRIVNSDDHPVIFLFSGKAHPNDGGGQGLIKKIIETSRTKEFTGKIFFIENYDMAVAKYLVSGVDLWLNTPTRPLEASGTSGQKAAMNGVVNFSVLDGWWAEGYKPNAGWAIPEETTYQNQHLQDELDSETIYNILEDDIIPLYYRSGLNGVPREWMATIRNTIAEVAPRFTMQRMLNDYYATMYRPMLERALAMRKDNFALARKVDAWKRKIIRGWSSIEAADMKVPDPTVNPLLQGEPFVAEVTLNTGELPAKDIGLEVIFGRKEGDVVEKVLFREEMKLVKTQQGLSTYRCEMVLNLPGVFDYAFRMYPKSPCLAHRQDFCLVKWF